MEQISGIGGVFFRTPDPAETAAWYKKHLGVEIASDFSGAVINWNGGEQTVWGLFETDTEYFGPSGQQYMINYRVSDLAAMLAQLRAAGVEVDEKRKSTASSAILAGRLTAMATASSCGNRQQTKQRDWRAAGLGEEAFVCFANDAEHVAEEPHCARIAGSENMSVIPRHDC